MYNKTSNMCPSPLFPLVCLKLRASKGKQAGKQASRQAGKPHARTYQADHQPGKLCGRRLAQHCPIGNHGCTRTESSVDQQRQLQRDAGCTLAQALRCCVYGRFKLCVVFSHVCVCVSCVCVCTCAAHTHTNAQLPHPLPPLLPHTNPKNTPCTCCTAPSSSTASSITRADVKKLKPTAPERRCEGGAHSNGGRERQSGGCWCVLNACQEGQQGLTAQQVVNASCLASASLSLYPRSFVISHSVTHCSRSASGMSSGSQTR